MGNCLTINQLVRLFNQKGPLHESQRASRVLEGFCKAVGIKDWAAFKKSAKSIKYYSKKLNKVMIIHGDKAPASGWSASEIEFVFKRDLSQRQLEMVHAAKEAFEGCIVI